MSQLSHPPAALLSVAAVDFELVQRPLQSFVGVVMKFFDFAKWTGTVFRFNFLNAHTTEAVSTASHLVGLSENQQTLRTLSLYFPWFVYELTIVSSLVLVHDCSVCLLKQLHRSTTSVRLGVCLQCKCFGSCDSLNCTQCHLHYFIKVFFCGYVICKALYTKLIICTAMIIHDSYAESEIIVLGQMAEHNLFVLCSSIV